MKQLTKKQAIKFAASKEYLKWDKKKLALFQLQQELLCTDFSYFHKCVEILLNRSVMSGEFENFDELLAEYIRRKE